MKMQSKTRLVLRCFAFVMLTAIIAATSTRMQANQTGTCGTQMITIPFDDVAPGNPFFCAIAEAFFSGLANGTSPTTYSPSANVPREQMAAFITRTLDQSLRRGSRRAALKQFWTPQGSFSVSQTSVGDAPYGVACDGTDLWVANLNDNTVSRVRASDGRLVETWTAADEPFRVLVAKGRIYVLGGAGKLYVLDPKQVPGAVTLLNVSLAFDPSDIAFDGDKIWITNGAGIQMVSFGLLCPCVTTVTAGLSLPRGLVYDGANMWVGDIGDGKLKKLDSSGNVIQSVTIGLNSSPSYAVFDGTNIWQPVPFANSIVVVRAASGVVVETLTGNGLDNPSEGAFDGERVLFVNAAGGNGKTVSVWKATDLSPLGSVQVSFGNDGAQGVCSDGLNFWITLRLTDKLARF